MTEDWQRIVEFIRSTNASDVYLNRCSVKGRVDGRVVRLSSPDDFTEEEFEMLVRTLLASRPDLLPSLDFLMEMLGMRFRVNVVRAQGKLSAALRPLPEIPPNPESLGLPEKVTKAITN